MASFHVYYRSDRLSKAFHQISNQITQTDQADGGKGCDNPQIDQYDTGLFDEVAYRIPLRGEIGATHDAEFSLSDEKNPAILGVNLNGAARACSLRNKYSVNAIGTSFGSKRT